MSETIDFVITWVDDSDPEWLKDRAKFLNEKEIDVARYRDWGLLKYWFRAIEKNAPWIRTIHFVTYGNVPKWLNVNNPKLHIVKHEDFIDKKYLPTFNSCAIEMNLYKIPGLSEQFVYFNDDVYLNKPVVPESFFRDGKPVDYAAFGLPGAEDYVHYCIWMNDVILLNKYFDKRVIKRKNRRLYLNIKYGLGNIKTILAYPWPEITGFDETHSFSPLLKTNYKEIWKLETEKMMATSSSKTRSLTDVNQYIFKYWSFCKGMFIPRKKEIEMFNPLNSDKAKKQTISAILKPTTLALCINDSKGKDFNQKTVDDIICAFEQRYPDKSSFEK